MKRRVVIIFSILGALIILGVSGFLLLPRILGSDAAANEQVISTAEVQSITVVNTIEASGSAEALQVESLVWKTTGTIDAVNIKVGDTVQEGEVLMSLDPLTVPDEIVQAQINLVTAQEALDALLNPSDLDIATAQQAVTTAEQTLEDAQQDLTYAQNPVGESLYEAVEDAQLTLETAQGNQQLQHVSADASEVQTTTNDMNLAYSRVQRAQTAMDDCIKISCGERVARENELNNAQKAYQTAWDAYQTALLQYDLNVASQTGTVEDAQEAYDDAVANLNAALAGPDAMTVKTAQDAVDVAEADLADKQTTLDELLSGADPNDIAAAQANVLAAQATLDALALTAPFDGEVLEINYRPGNTANTTDTAIVIADRSQLYVDVAVDESDIGSVNPGDPATLSFDSLPDVLLSGTVSQVSAVGQEVSGLVKYTVRVDFDQADRRVLLGMTTSAEIVAETIENALAVSIDAIQEDDDGEYVVRVQGGTPEIVRVVSGNVQDNDLVSVTGDLQAGDMVQLSTSTTADNSTTGGFPGGGGGGGFPGGGGGGPGAGGAP